MRLEWVFLFFALSAAGAAGQDIENLQLNPEAEQFVSKDDLARGMKLNSEIVAMKYFGAICLKHRNSAPTARKALKTNGYVQLGEKDNITELWVRPGTAPVVLLNTGSGPIDRCTIIIGKSVARVANLENMLDDLGPDDIQRLGEDIVPPPEKGWVLRPGFEYVVYLMKMGSNSAITLSRID